MTNNPPEPDIDVDSDIPHSYRRRSDVLGVLWVIGVALVALVPAMLHGKYIGSFDFLGQHGLTYRPGASFTMPLSQDIEDEVVPWAQLAWTQVHQGHLPLWAHMGSRDASGVQLRISGVQFARTRQLYLAGRGRCGSRSSSLSCVGGTGAYFFGRVLGLHPMACALAGTTWVLSGPFFGYLGLPDTSAMSWAGWQFAAVVLILRGASILVSPVVRSHSRIFDLRRKSADRSDHFAPAGGVRRGRIIWRQRRSFTKTARSLVRLSTWPSRLSREPRSQRRSSFPVLQLANTSVRTSGPFGTANPPSQVLGIFFQSFWGQPIAASFRAHQGFFQRVGSMSGP